MPACRDVGRARVAVALAGSGAHRHVRVGRVSPPVGRAAHRGGLRNRTRSRAGRNRVVFHRGTNARLVSLDRANGSERWSLDTGVERISGVRSETPQRLVLEGTDDTGRRVRVEGRRRRGGPDRDRRSLKPVKLRRTCPTRPRCRNRWSHPTRPAPDRERHIDPQLCRAQASLRSSTKWLTTVGLGVRCIQPFS